MVSFTRMAGHLYICCFTLSKLLVSNSFNNLNHTSFYGLWDSFRSLLCCWCSGEATAQRLGILMSQSSQQKHTAHYVVYVSTPPLHSVLALSRHWIEMFMCWKRDECNIMGLCTPFHTAEKSVFCARRRLRAAAPWSGGLWSSYCPRHHLSLLPPLHSAPKFPPELQFRYQHTVEWPPISLNRARISVKCRTLVAPVTPLRSQHS